ncbi:MAG: hypothetical protein JO316_25560 [Abitibacteriaceae bacterium]|nr:hypothetical protein [Abditibacteriaceae bacterium]
MVNEVRPSFWLSESAAQTIIAAMVQRYGISVEEARNRLQLHINNELPPDRAITRNVAAGMLLEEVGLQAMGVELNVVDPFNRQL